MTKNPNINIIPHVVSGEMNKHNPELKYDNRHGVLLTVGGLFRTASELEDDIIYSTNRLDYRLEFRLIGSKKSAGDKLPFISSYIKLVSPPEDNYPENPKKATVYIPNKNFVDWESRKNLSDLDNVFEVAPDPKLVAVEINKRFYYIIESPIGKEYIFGYNRKGRPVKLEWLEANMSEDFGKKLTLRLTKIKDSEAQMVRRVIKDFCITDLRSIKYKD